MALTLSMLMWLVAFLSVGGEWFLMWQSHAWNGQEAAFRMFAVVGIVLLILLQPETDDSAVRLQASDGRPFPPECVPRDSGGDVAEIDVRNARVNRVGRGAQIEDRDQHEHHAP